MTNHTSLIEYAFPILITAHHPSPSDASLPMSTHSTLPHSSSSDTSSSCPHWHPSSASQYPPTKIQPWHPHLVLPRAKRVHQSKVSRRFELLCSVAAVQRGTRVIWSIRIYSVRSGLERVGWVEYELMFFLFFRLGFFNQLGWKNIDQRLLKMYLPKNIPSRF